MMNTAEKIRYFRTAFGMTQETLSELSGINVATIKKYEYGERNPKPDQIMKIAKALGISIYAFMDFDISTVSDVISLIMKLDAQTGISFDYKADKADSSEKASVALSFADPQINKAVKEYISIKKRLSDAEAAYAAIKPETRTEEDNKKLLAVREEMNTARLKLLRNAADVRKNPE